VCAVVSILEVSQVFGADSIDKRVNGIGKAPRKPIVTIEKFADKAH
jgi:hypothetical protein